MRTSMRTRSHSVEVILHRRGDRKKPVEPSFSEHKLKIGAVHALSLFGAENVLKRRHVCCNLVPMRSCERAETQTKRSAKHGHNKQMHRAALLLLSFAARVLARARARP
jgi:hypothetical protein